MKYFIVSDIHSNIQALDAVLKHRGEHYPDSVLICLGDIVGYGANPAECITAVFDSTNNVIMGNHDSGTAGITDIACFNSYAREAILWTRKTLPSNMLNHLKRLPLKQDMHKFVTVHASLGAPEKWHYINSVYRAQDEMNMQSHQIVFSGHTHIPALFIKGDNGVKMIDDFSHCELNDHELYIVNPGSVGQPRDGDSRASAIVYDSDAKTIKKIRIEYNMEKAQYAIREAGLPEYLAQRLEKGL